MSDLLILGGTTEARMLCAQVHLMGIDATVSLAGVTSRPETLPIKTRNGGFGGVDGLCSWLEMHRTKALIDATHPFATKMPTNAEAACARLGLPRLRLVRPGFARVAGWSSAPNLEAALLSLQPDQNVLLTTGKNDLGGVAQRPDLRILIRTIEPIEDLPSHARNLLIRPPLNWEAEIDMLAQHEIDVLIAKDSGGVTAPKLDAANALGVRVILIDRPPQPPGPIVTTVDEAVAWLPREVAIGT